MNKSVLHILLLLLLLMQACTSELPEVPGRAVALMSYTSQAVTRADSAILAENGIPGGTSIGVYAYYHDNATWADDAVPNFMLNQRATNNGLNEPFSYSPVKYWPNEEEDKLSFIAYYPYCSGSAADIDKTGITPELNNLGAGVPHGYGLPTFRYQVKNDVKKQCDFMVSDLKVNLPDSRATDPNPGNPFDNLRIIDRVRFYFRHATSKIEFRVTVADDIRDDLAYFILRSIDITNIYDEGLLTVGYNSGAGSTNMVWSDFSDAHKSDYSCKTTEAYLLLPQTLRNDARLSIGYDLAFKSEGTTYTYSGTTPVANEEYVYSNRSASVQLNTLTPNGSATPLTTWLPNHHYLYVIRLGAKRIDFTAQVVDWGDAVDINEITVEE